MNRTVFNCTEEDFVEKTCVSDDKFNEYSTCQSNDSEGSFGNPSEHSVEFESKIISVPKEVSESKSVTTNEKVMIIHSRTWRTYIFDSGCSAHMTGNKDHLDDFEECKGGSVTFGGSKCYIT
ncbi:hypothetical protein Tco_0022064, partial [Tanacetum coccineum]